MTLGDALLELEVPEHRPGFFDVLRDSLGGQAPGVVRPRLLLVAAAAVIVAGALAFSLTRGSEVASAAQVRAAVERALAAGGSISGVYVNNESHKPGAPGTRARFVLSSTGAFQIVDERGLGFRERLVFDPARNTETTAGGTSDFVRFIGLAPGPPDAGPELFDLQLGLGSVIASLADAHDSSVENVNYDGRPAWLLRAPTGNPGEQTVLTVDRATGMPVRNQLFRHGRFVAEIRIEHLRVSKTVPHITPPAPARVEKVHILDAGFRRMSLAAAGRSAGYSPLVPTRLPHGFVLTTVAFAAKARPTGEELGDGAGNPSRDVISLAYRRGFDEIVVTTRRTGPDPSTWKDPFQVAHVTADTPRRIEFTGGALAGERGYVFVAPGVFPHVWTAGPKLVVTVAGTVDRADLLEVANSLQETP